LCPHYWIISSSSGKTTFSGSHGNIQKFQAGKFSIAILLSNWLNLTMIDWSLMALSAPIGYIVPLKTMLQLKVKLTALTVT